MTTVAIHQPEYMPCLSYLDKAARSDIFVLFDDVQFNRANLQHRCKISSGADLLWMTIAFVHTHAAVRERIDQVAIARDSWADDHALRVRLAYEDKAPAFAEVWPLVDEFYATRTMLGQRSLANATIASVQFLMNAFGVAPELIVSSKLDAEGKKGDRVLDICQKLGATRYLSGKTGASYLNRDAFDQAGIEIAVQDFTMPRYREWQPDPDGQGRGLSALDAWMYLGANAKGLVHAASP